MRALPMDAFARRPRKPFIGLSVAAITGIVAADLLPLSAPWLLAVSLGTAAATFFRPLKAPCWVLTFLVFALLHTTRHQDHPARLFAGALPESGQSAEMEGIVWSEPNVFNQGRGKTASFWVRLNRISAAPSLSNCLCLVRWSGESPSYGDRVLVKGIVRRLNEARNPGEFDTSGWLQRQGIHFQLHAKEPADCSVIGHREGQWFRHFALDARQSIKHRLDHGLPADPDVSTLISSMVLGMRGETPPDLKELFQKTGTLHLFAVSGLNVGMLAVIAWYVLKPFRVPRRRAALLIIPFLGAYAVVVGMSASCVRATVMAIFVLLAPVFERESVPVNSLAAAAFSIVAWDTNEFFNPGFQLSFFLVLAILALSRPIQVRCEKPGLPDEFIPRRLWSPAQHAQVAITRLVAASVGVGLASWIGSLVFMAGYFHLVSPVALIANLVAVPIAFLILSLGMFSLITGTLFASLAIIINHANWLCARTLIATVEFFAHVPRGHLYVEWPTMAQESACEILVLDAGEGGAAHLRAAGRDWMIDAGHQRNYAGMLLPYLRSRGVDRLDGVLFTHGDAAHVGGAPMLLKDFAPGWIGDTFTHDRSPSRRALHYELASAKQGRRFFHRGDTIPLSDDVQVEVLYPPEDWPRGSADDKSVVFRLQAAGARVLFMSDTGFAVEQWLLQNESDLRADAIVKGWPERDLSGTLDFIAAVDPSTVICATPNFGSGETRFAEWADPLRTRGILVLAQQECGAVRLQIASDAVLSVTPWRPLLR